MMLRALTAAIALSVAAAGNIAVAAPPVVEAAKADCIVGERIDGYLGIIDEGKADASLRREVRDVNQKRRAAYAALAEKNGVPESAAAAATAEKLINSAPSGHCVQNASGSWVRVP